MKKSFKLLLTLGLAVTGMAAVGAGISSNSSAIEESKASTTSSEASFNIWIWDQKEQFDHIYLSSISYESGYDVNDLKFWFDNFKGSNFEGSSSKFNGSATIVNTDKLDVYNSSIESGTHYGETGKHRVFQFPHFVTGLSYSINSKFGGSLSCRTNLTAKKRYFDKYWADNSTSHGVYGSQINDYSFTFTKYTVSIHDQINGESSKTIYECEKAKLGTPVDAGGGHFKNWYTDSSHSSDKYWDPNSAIKSDLNLYPMYEKLISSSSMVMSSTTRRIWFRADISGWYDANAKSGVRAWGSAGYTNYDAFIYEAKSIANLAESADKYYWYADIPVDATGYQFVRLDPNNLKNTWTYAESLTFSDNSYKVHYIIADNKVSYGSPNSLSANVAALILEGYTTCSDNAQYGYKGITNYTSAYYNKMSDVEKATFATTEIIDYGSKSASSKSATVLAGDKYDMMNELNGSSSSRSVFSVLVNEDSAPTITIIIVSLIALTAVGGFIFLKKRKEVC